MRRAARVAPAPGPAGPSPRALPGVVRHRPGPGLSPRPCLAWSVTAPAGPLAPGPAWRGPPPPRPRREC